MLTLQDLRRAISNARRRGVGWESPVFLQMGHKERTGIGEATISISMEPSYDFNDGDPIRRLRASEPVLTLLGD